MSHVGTADAARRKRTKQWWRSLNHYIRNEDDKMPPAGRYNAGQKSLFWGFFYGAIILAAHVGSFCGSRNIFPGTCGGSATSPCSCIPSAALVTIAKFMIHIYMSVFAERGRVRHRVIRGDVSLEFAKRYHPGWYKEIVGRSSPAPRK